MKNSIFLIVLVLITNSVWAQKLDSSNAIIDRFLTEEYPKNEPGAAVLIAKDGEVVFEKAYGLSSLKPKKKLKTDMVFQIASMSKQFVSAAVLQLVQKGAIKLDEPIQTYVPYYPEKTYPVTVHHLLSQTSGIPEYFDVDESEFELLARDYTPKQLIDFYKNEPLIFRPGERYHYSSSNYPLLGLAIENVTGLSLRDYLEKTIFDPLGMHATSLWYRDDTKAKQIVTGYAEKNGSFVKGPEISSTAIYAPGGIVSNVKDQWKWYKALRDKSTISEYVIDQLITEKRTTSGEGTAYGYGFAIKELQGKATYQHSGILFGFTSTAMFVPEPDVFVCILSNTKFDRTEELSNYCASVMMGDPIEIFSKSEISKELLNDFIGFYELQSEELERSFELLIFDNQLILHDPKAPQNDAILTPAGEDRFVLKTAGAYFKFVRDQDNRVLTMEITQQDDFFVFKKTD